MITNADLCLSSASLRVIALFCLIATTLVGCSDEDRPDRVPVSGTVMIDGKPLTEGKVRFVPSEGRPSQGEIDSKGRFTLSCFKKGDGAVLGSHRVQVVSNELLGETKIRWHAPKKYASYKTSGLVEEISEPVEDLVIELTWNGGKPFEELQ